MRYNLEETEKKLFAPGPSPFEAPERPLAPCGALPLPETEYGRISLDGTWLLTRGGEEIPDFSGATPARVTNTSAVPAVGIFLENPSHDTAFTAGRNFFCLLPGESARIPVSHTDGQRLQALNLLERDV